MRLAMTGKRYHNGEEQTTADDSLMTERPFLCRPIHYFLVLGSVASMIIYVYNLVVG